MKKSFVLYTEWVEIVNALSDEQAGKLMKAIFTYVKGGDVELDPMMSVVFIPIRQTLSRDNEKWQNIVDRNRANGSKGGRPKKKTQSNPENPDGYLGNPKNLDNDNVNDIDNDIKDSNSKNSLLPLTKQDRIELALSLRVEIADIHRCEQDVLNPENISKYGYKTTFHTVKKWINRAISKGTQRTLDATGMMVLEGLYGKGAQL